MKKLLPLICYMLFLATISKAQYVNIPDSVFRDYLIQQYPNYFNSNKQLDTVLAANSNEEFFSISGGLYDAKNIDGIQYFKKIKKLDISFININSINYLPPNLRMLKLLTSDSLSSISYFPLSLDSLDIWEVPISTLPQLPNNLKFLSLYYTSLTNLPNLPNSIETIWLGGHSIDTIYNLPSKLKYFYSDNNRLKKIFYLPNQLIDFESSDDSLISLPALPITLKYLGCQMNTKINQLPTLPNNLEYLGVEATSLTSLPTLPSTLINLNIKLNHFTNIPTLPKGLRSLDCSWNKNIVLNYLPDSLRVLECSDCNLTFLPPLPKFLSSLSCVENNLQSLPSLQFLDSLTYINCQYNKLASFSSLPKTLVYLYCNNNTLTYLPPLPNSLRNLFLDSNNITCLPYLSDSLENLSFDTAKIKCLTNIPYYLTMDFHKICNPLNNPNHCQSFPSIQLFAYTDNNNNNKFGLNEYPKNKLKLTLTNDKYTYTNTRGSTEIYADSLGTYTITPTVPNFYNVVPASYTHNFSTYDTLVIDTFALQAIVLKDSIAIKLTPTNWAARAGRSYPYLASYENVGTTVLSNAAVSLHYDNSLLNYDSSSVSAVTNSGSNLTLNIGNVLPGQTGGFVAYFTVSPTAVLNSSFTSVANITTNTVAATDTVVSVVRGSYDPNDKQATPSLTLQEVSSGKNIDYTIRFQNTGTDTAFNVVIADTLDSKLLANQVQMVGSSHPCRTTVKDNIIFFEFLDIMLPDSNINKFGSNGFVSFKIKPIPTVTDGTIIPNKAAIYFDYNSPVITKPANTIIQNPLPLQLLSFSAITQNELSKILVYWNTANEVNTAYSIIETSSDGTNFKAVAEVAAKGIGNNSYFYSIDKATVVYVRLKMVDKNGLFTYSNIIKLSSNTQDSNGLIVLQNPAKHQLKLNVVSSKLNNTNASLTNAEGRVIKRFILQQGNQTIDISGIAAGVYYLQSNEGSKKVVVE